MADAIHHVEEEIADDSDLQLKTRHYTPLGESSPSGAEPKDETKGQRFINTESKSIQGAMKGPKIEHESKCHFWPES